jgi:hypothetical protein
VFSALPQVRLSALISRRGTRLISRSLCARRWRLAGLLLLLLSLSAAPLEAASQNRNLVGQEQFTRTSGATNIFQRTFSIPAYVSAPYALHVINGNPDGSSRVGIEDSVSSAEIFLDQVQVVAPNEFSHTVATID